MSSLKWTSLKLVYDKILRDPLFIGLSYESIVDYFIDFINIVGTPELFDEKITDPPLKISNYRAELPTDFVEEIQLNINKSVARYASDTFINYYNLIDNIRTTQYYGVNIFNKYTALRGSKIQTDGSIITNTSYNTSTSSSITAIPSTRYVHSSQYDVSVAQYNSSNVFIRKDTIHPQQSWEMDANGYSFIIEFITVEMDRMKVELGTSYTGYTDYIDINIKDVVRAPIDMTYSIKGDFIYTSIESGDMLMTYKCIKVQDDPESEDYGYPMMVDDAVFTLALKSYIEVEFLKMLYRSGKINNQILDEAKQTYAWNVGRYETHSRRLTLGKMETISKMFRSIQVKSNAFGTRFKNLGTD